MKTTKLYLRSGEKGRLEIEPNVALEMDSVQWKSTSGVVALDKSEQKTPLDMRVIATGHAGMGYVEVTARVAGQNRSVNHVFEVHNQPNDTSGELNGFARLSRSYRRHAESDNTPADAAPKTSGDSASPDKQFYGDAAAADAEKPAASSETDQTHTQRMGADNPTQSAGLPEKPGDHDGRVIESSPVNDATTTSLKGTIGSPAFASGAKPTGTSLGIDTITPEVNGILTAPETVAEEKPQDRAKLDEALENARRIDKQLKEEAKKLPSQTELSGEPREAVILPPQTVAADDARAKDKDVENESEGSVEKESPEEQAAPETVTEKTLVADQAEKSSDKSDDAKADKPKADKPSDEKSDDQNAAEKKGDDSKPAKAEKPKADQPKEDQPKAEKSKAKKPAKDADKK